MGIWRGRGGKSEEQAVKFRRREKQLRAGQLSLCVVSSASLHAASSQASLANHWSDASPHCSQHILSSEPVRPVSSLLPVESERKIVMMKVACQTMLMEVTTPSGRREQDNSAQNLNMHHEGGRGRRAVTEISAFIQCYNVQTLYSHLLSISTQRLPMPHSHHNLILSIHPANLLRRNPSIRYRKQKKIQMFHNLSPTKDLDRAQLIRLR